MHRRVYLSLIGFTKEQHDLNQQSNELTNNWNCTLTRSKAVLRHTGSPFAFYTRQFDTVIFRRALAPIPSTHTITLIYTMCHLI